MAECELEAHNFGQAQLDMWQSHLKFQADMFNVFHKEIGITLLALIHSKVLSLISRQSLELQAKKMPAQRAGRHIQVFHKEIG